MELKNVSEVVKDCEFVVFKSALENGGSVRGINAEGQGHMPRKKIDALVEYAKGFGAKGLAYIAINEDGTYKSSFALLISSLASFTPSLKLFTPFPKPLPGKFWPTSPVCNHQAWHQQRSICSSSHPCPAHT